MLVELYMKLQPFYKIQPQNWHLTNRTVIKIAQEQAYKKVQDDNHVSIEYVRQWLIQELVKSYYYPLEWLNDRIGLEEDDQFNDTIEDSSLVVLNSCNGDPFVVLQIFPLTCSDSKFIQAEKEFEKILTQFNTSRIGCITRGVETKVIRRNSGTNSFEYISDLPEYKPHFGNGIFYTRTNTNADPNDIGKTTHLIPLPKRVKTIFFELHSAIRDIDGFHDDIALDELCKVLYVKIHDENRNFYNKPLFIFQTHGAHNESEVASVIRALYETAYKQDIKSHVENIPDYDRSRGVFKEPINLSDTALSKIVEKLQMYTITNSDNDIKSHVFQQVLGRAIRSGMGQFFTPDEIVQLAVEITSPKPTDLILDPFCGSGHFLSRSIDYVSKQFDSDLVSIFKLHNLHGIEKSPRMVRIAMTDMLLHNDANANIRNADALATPDNFPDILEMNTSAIKSDDLAVFDLILTNPPFGKILGDENRSSLESFHLAQKKKSIPFEIIALERCSQFLKKGGKLAIVLPDGNLANSQTQYFRDWLLANFILKAVVSLPTETFAPYGTTTKTSLCFFQKFKKETDKDFDYDIAFYKLDNIGYDGTGRAIDGSEVSDAIEYLKTTLIWD